MRKIKTESTGTSGTPAGSKDKRTPLIIMGVIVVLAAFVRVAFSVGTSAGSDFALSGGSVSTNNLYILTELIANGTIVLSDSSLYYPYGTVFTAPFLFTLAMYPFAALVNVFVSDPTLASSIVLASSGPVFAVASVIAAYFLGKSMLKSRFAGYLTALFMALCPIFVKESVFSNGSGTSFILFFFVLCIFFLYKAISTVGYKEGDESNNRKAYGLAAVAGIFLAIVAITWSEFRAVVLPLLAVMMVQVLVDRFKGKDPVPLAIVYSITLLIGIVAAGLYYGLAGLWTQVASGIVVLTFLVCASNTCFAVLKNKPWTLTIPATLIISTAIFVAIAIALPELSHFIFSGNPIYDEAYLETLGKMKLSLSTLSTYYGALTYWFVFIAVIGMIYKFRANAGSAPYVFTMVWLFIVTVACGHNATQAAIATPVFAIGFAAVVSWIFAHIDFKAYFSAIKTASGKQKVRRLFKPAPFVSIVMALLLVVGPNVTYVLDASISSNDVDDYNEAVSSVIDREPFGSLNYYIKTDESWKVREALKGINDRVSDGALISWMDYSADAPLYAGLKSYTDSNGHGMVDVSNILLANALTGGSSAAILLNAIIYLGGITDQVRAELTAAGLGDSVDTIAKVLDSVNYKVDGKTIRYIVTTDVEKYGNVDENISDENVKYLYITNLLADTYPQFTINQAYDNLADKFDLETPYVMVTGDMMPFYYGYSGVFNEMALLNGYSVNSSNYTVSKYTMFGIDAYYYGVYGFTDEMYDTLLYRTYIGMSPEEAGYTSIYNYMTALSNADSSVVMQPGYGLSNYSVVYWQVMYNASDNADADSDGWEQMDGYEAIEKQKVEGGRINYLSGLPVIVSYDSNGSGKAVSGKVVNAGYKEARVSAIDKDGNLRATAYTNANGEYTLFVKDPANTSLVFFAGSRGVTGGVIFDTKSAPADGNVEDVTMPKVKVNIDMSYQSYNDSLDKSKYDVTITNTVTDDVINTTLDKATGIDLSLGTYEVIIMYDGDKLLTQTFVTSLNDNQTVTFYIDLHEYIITLRDEFRQTDIGPASIRVDGEMFSGTFDKKEDGKYYLYVPEGDYILSAENVYLESPILSVSSDSSKTIDVSAGKTVFIEHEKLVDGMVVNFVNDAHRTSAVVKDGKAVATLPMSDFGKTAYTISFVNDGKVYYQLVEDLGSMVSVDFHESDARKVTGTLKNAGGTTVSGMVTLYTKHGEMFRTSVGKDGAFTLYNVPNEDLLVYATNGSSEAYFATYAKDATDPIAADMVSADSIKPTVRWSSASAQYLNVKITEIAGFEGYTLYFTVDTSGAYEIVVPKTLVLSITLALNEGMLFKTGDETTADTITTTLTEASHSAPSYTLYAGASKDQKIKVKNDLDLKDEYPLDIGSSETVGEVVTDGISASSSISFDLGEVATEDNTNSGIYYIEGTYYFCPFTFDFDKELLLSELFGFDSKEAAMEAITYKRVVFTGLDESDHVSVEGDYKAGNSKAEGGQEYLFHFDETETSAIVTITNSDSTKIQYVKVTKDSPGSVAASPEDKVTVKGYVGIDAEGTIYVEYADVTLEFEIEDGMYKVDVYKNKPAKFNPVVDDNGMEYKPEAPVEFTPTADCTRNFVVSGFGNIHEMKADTVVGDGTYLKVTKEINGSNLKNTGDAGYYNIVFGEGWESAYAVCGGKIVTQLYVEEDGNFPTFSIEGYYNSAMYDLTSKAMLITLEGPSNDQYIYLTPPEPFGSSGSLVYFNKVDDIVGDHAYSYVIDVNNMTGNNVIFNISNWATGVDPNKWTIMVEVEAFGVTLLFYEITPSSPGTAQAFPGVTTYKVTFIPVGTETDVPDLDLACEITTPGITLATFTPDEVTVDNDNGKLTVKAEAGSASVKAEDMDAEGRGVFNDAGSIPTIVWVLFALSIILAILTVWMATKRGVFTRRK